MTGQIRDLMPSLELPILRRVVRLSFSAPAPATGGDDMDAIKCNSLQWLLQRDEHLEDALVCANILLREFLMNEEEDKTTVAMAFMNDYLPEDFLDLVSSVYASQDASESMNADKSAKVNNAVTEHLAYMTYLDAYGTFEKLKETLKDTPTALEDHKRPNYNNLNEVEKNIANSNFITGWVKEKKKHLERTITAAMDAREAWYKVLTHPGGWLLVDDDDVSAPSAGGDLEEQKRLMDIPKIRSRHLVLAANLYHQVCEETASWLSRSLNEAENLQLPKEEVLRRLQSSCLAGKASGSDDDDGSHTPNYWYKHALDLATLVASDKHGIHRAFPPIDLQDLITKLGETAVSKLMNV